jgi:hypothetical protein
MSRIEKIYVFVAIVQNLLFGDELLLVYNYHRSKPNNKKIQEIDLPLEVLMGCKKKEIK